MRQRAWSVPEKAGVPMMIRCRTGSPASRNLETAEPLPRGVTGSRQLRFRALARFAGPAGDGDRLPVDARHPAAQASRGFHAKTRGSDATNVPRCLPLNTAAHRPRSAGSVVQPLVGFRCLFFSKSKSLSKSGSAPVRQDAAVASITKPDRFGDPIPILIWTGARLTAPGPWFCAEHLS